MTVTHPEQQPHYDAGRDATAQDIREMGFDAAIAKWRSDNPQGHKFSSLSAYYYAKGGLDELAANK